MCITLLIEETRSQRFTDFPLIVLEYPNDLPNSLVCTTIHHPGINYDQKNQKRRRHVKMGNSGSWKNCKKRFLSFGGSTRVVPFLLANPV